MENFVVIDLGSNSVRMTITKINDDSSFETVTQMKEYVRLSANMGPKHELQPAAVDRTIRALKKFKTVYDQVADRQLIAVATAAVRQASNQKKFLKRVREELGLELHVISGTEEARYDYIGVTHTLPTRNCIILDTGGGSAELALVEAGRAKNLISIPLGSVTLSQRFLEPDIITAKSLYEAMSFVNDIFNGVWWLRDGLNLPIVGLGGANRTLAKIQRNTENFRNFEDIHGYRISSAQVSAIFSGLLNLDLNGRKKVPGLSKERADIIIGGLIPLVLLMRFIDSDRVTFSNSGLREGILYEHLEQLGQH
ncbi:exopolyphosphatase [Levilactobacillus bambusae]|uniref:exopolyphosphatase n=1 Tax=Levilactobacillus bambusae TaxID=2024736 RepID=A0A2V1MY79_9LACO|nr:exopolyphosphatase [Levilactobacillus bambusae]PWF99467.1 exopolyphosphatase [Levilactobacillus bambusae]